MKSCRAPPTICFFHRCNWRRAHNTKQQKKVGHNPTVLTRSPRYWLFFHLFFFLFLFTALYLVSDTVDWKIPTVKTYESLRIGVSNISYLNDWVMLLNFRVTSLEMIMTTIQSVHITCPAVGSLLDPPSILCVSVCSAVDESTGST